MNEPHCSRGTDAQHGVRLCLTRFAHTRRSGLAFTFQTESGEVTESFTPGVKYTIEVS